MKGFVKIVTLSLFVLFASSFAYSCSCVIEPLAKRFKRADAVFIGHQTIDYPDNDREIQNMPSGSVVLKVVRSWKGISKKFVAVNFGDVKTGSMCITLSDLPDDVDYLVFAYGKRLEVRRVCSDSRVASDEISRREIKLLEKPWFRFRSRIWPFWR